MPSHCCGRGALENKGVLTVRVVADPAQGSSLLANATGVKNEPCVRTRRTETFINHYLSLTLAAIGMTVTPDGKIFNETRDQ